MAKRTDNIKKARAIRAFIASYEGFPEFAEEVLTDFIAISGKRTSVQRQEFAEEVQSLILNTLEQKAKELESP